MRSTRALAFALLLAGCDRDHVGPPTTAPLDQSPIPAAAARPVPPSPPVPGSCVDLHPLADQARVAALGIVRLTHQAGPALAEAARATAGVIVARPGFMTRLPIEVQAGEPNLGVTLVDGELLGDPRDPAAGVFARVAYDRGEVAIEPTAAIVGSAIRLGDFDRGAVMVAFGDDGVAHLARARAHVAARPGREVVAVLAHDVDRDGTRELIVRSVIEDATREGELDVLWASGRVATMADGSIDGYALRWWQLGAPDASGEIPWLSVAWCCAGVTVVTTSLGERGFAKLDHAHDGDELAACVELDSGRPTVTFRPRP